LLTQSPPMGLTRTMSSIPRSFTVGISGPSPLGNGPYRYVRHIAKAMVEVEANPHYYRGKPRIERVILKFSPQPLLTELLSENVDALTFATRDMLLKLSGIERFRSYHWWGSRINAIYWNHRHSLFHRPKTRRALTMAINRRELGDVLNYPDSIPVLDTITTRRQFQQGLYPAPFPYDPEAARRLLDRDGWRDTDGNGVRERDGEEFRFTAIAPHGDWEKIAVYLQDQFRRIGVRMEIQVMDAKFVRRRLKAGEFEAIIVLTSNSTTQNFGHARMFGEDSPFGYANPEMIRLLNLAVETIDPDEKDRIYQEIMPIFAEDMPITLLLPEVQTHIVHRRIQGLNSPWEADPVWNMEYLWIEDQE
ncbi:MAG: ABC transporter substrate-binding protein, partial [Acidobacteriota bacterium]